METIFKTYLLTNIFFFCITFRHKDGHKKFDAFKLHWSVNCRKEPTLKTFFSEELIPYWAQCSKCQKWRQLDRDEELTPEYSELFECKKVDIRITPSVTFVSQKKSVLRRVS